MYLIMEEVFGPNYVPILVTRTKKLARDYLKKKGYRYNKKYNLYYAVTTRLHNSNNVVKLIEIEELK